MQITDIPYNPFNTDHANDILCLDLRKCYLVELEASYPGKPANVALLEFIEEAEGIVRLVYVDDILVYVYGVNPTDHPAAGICWGVGSDFIHTVPIAAWKTAKRMLVDCHAIYPILFSYPAEENEVTIKWLILQGYSHTGRKYEVNGTSFIELIHA